MSGLDGSLFESAARRSALLIDRIADEFEAAWIAGASPRIADFVPDTIAEHRVALLEELILIDQAFRAKLGETPGRDQYRLEFPELPRQSPAIDCTAGGAAVSIGGAPGGNSDKGTMDTPTTGAARPELPGYELLAELGRGSMGVVYKARQLGLKRDVAVKMVLAGSFAGGEQLARFRLEAESVARLRHPNIVQIYEVGQHAGLPYCVLEYVEGGSLAQRINGYPQPPRAAAELVETIARAVHAAHSQGVVHRDLKPANILIGGDGSAKVADFGLAKQLDVDSGFTQSGMAVGTPSYMAPEQAAGRSGAVGPATDVYALGGILYELLTGRPPFRGATLAETLELVRSAPLVSPRRLQPNLPRDLETICVKAMERDSSHRYATAEALADDLRRWLDHKAILARPSGPLRKTFKWARRRPALAALCVLTIITAAGGIAGGWWHTVGLQRALDETDRARRQAEALRAESEQQRDRAEAMIYATDMQLASAAYLKGDMFETSRRLERHLPAPHGTDRREFTWKLLRALQQPNELAFRGHDGDAYVVRVVANGRQLVSAGRDGTLRLWDASDPASSRLLGKFDSELNFVAAAPNGELLAVGSDDGRVRLWDVSTRAETGQFAAHAHWVLCGAISPAGDRLATGGRDNIVRIWTLDGQLVRELKGHTSTIESLTFLPDGRSLASTSTDRTLRLWDVASGAGSVLAPLPSPAYCVACSHNGRLLATGGEDHGIDLWDVESRAQRGRLTGHHDWVQCVEFSPDDTRLASAGKDGAVRVWDVARQVQIESIAANASRMWSVAWMPDGSGLASSAGDGTIRLWRPQLDRLNTPLDETSENIQHVFLTAGGACFYPIKTEGGLSGLGMRSANRPRRLLSARNRTLSGFDWCASRDGKTLAVSWSNEPSADQNDPSHQAEIYDTTGTRLRVATLSQLGPDAPVIALDGDRLAALCRNGQLKLHDLASGRRCWAQAIGFELGHRIRFAPKGDEVICSAGDRNRVVAYRASDGKARTVIDVDAKARYVVGLAIGRDNRYLATGGQDGIVRIWDYRSRNAELVHLDGNDGQINALAFSPDDRTLAVGTETGTILFWHTATWQPLARFRTRLASVHDFSFSPAGDSLAITGRSRTDRGEILLWQTQPAAP